MAFPGTDFFGSCFLGSTESSCMDFDRSSSTTKRRVAYDFRGRLLAFVDLAKEESIRTDL
jgi:hypothetical protein